MTSFAHAVWPRWQRPTPPRPSRRAAVPEFSPGGDFTVGVEEELMVVDSAGELMGAAATPLVDSLLGATHRDGVKREIYADQVELNSPVCVSAEDVASHLRRLRARCAEVR